MAYTLGDPFRPLRLVLRINGVVIGLGVGLGLLLTPGSWLTEWGIGANGLHWPLRLAGASQIGVGLFFLLAAQQDYLSRLPLFAALVTNALWAMILLSAYLRRELLIGPLFGQILFVLIFLLCLLGAVMPLRYLRSSE